MPDQPHYTKTQRLMLNVLADGQRHTREELHACLEDDLAQMGTVNVHLVFLRKKLRDIGENIICEVCNRRNYYRRIKLREFPST